MAHTAQSSPRSNSGTKGTLKGDVIGLVGTLADKLEAARNKNRVVSEENRIKREHIIASMEPNVSLANELLVFFGKEKLLEEGKEKRSIKVNFDSMNIEQQNAVLDKAISLIPTVNDSLTIENFVNSVNSISLSSGAIEIKSMSDISTKRNELLRVLTKLRKSDRAASNSISIIRGIWDRLFGPGLYSADGTKRKSSPSHLDNQLVAYFNSVGLTGVDFINMEAALFGGRQSILAILEQLSIRESFIKDDVYEHYKQHITELHELLSLDIRGIKGLTSGHALYALLISLKDENLTLKGGETLKKLLGEDMRASSISGLLHKLLAESALTESAATKKLMDNVVKEIREGLYDACSGKTFDEVFDHSRLSSNVLYEIGHVENVIPRQRGSVHEEFVSSHASVLEVIKNGGDTDGSYSKLLINNAIESGDAATILHMISLLDPEKHQEIFKKFNGLFDGKSEINETELRKFVKEIKDNKDAYFKDGVVAFGKIDVEQEVDFAKQDYSGHEDTEWNRLIEVMRSNAMKQTPNSDKKE